MLALTTILLNLEYLLIALSAGFGTAVWLIAARNDWRRSAWRTISYCILAVAYTVAGALIVATLIGRPFLLPTYVSVFILIPVLILPPALYLHDWLTAKAIVEEVKRKVNGE